MYYYQLKSKLKKKYISYEETNKEISKAYCESSWKSLSENRNIRLRLIKLYKENENINKESDLLEKEPIDVVIKYIDINDTSLKRENLEQVKKTNKIMN
jgi:superoxide dismutase